MKISLFLLVLSLVLINCASNNVPRDAEIISKNTMDYDLALEDEKLTESIMKDIIFEFADERYVYIPYVIVLSKLNIDDFAKYKLIDINIFRDNFHNSSYFELEFESETTEGDVIGRGYFPEFPYFIEAYDENLDITFYYLPSERARDVFNSLSGVNGYVFGAYNNVTPGFYLINTLELAYKNHLDELERIAIREAEARERQRMQQEQTALGKLIQNIMDVGIQVGSPFRDGEVVQISGGLFRAIDYSYQNGFHSYLVIFTDYTVRTIPFYIESDRQLNTIGAMRIEYKGTAQYLDGRVPRNTLRFREIR